MKNLQNKMNSPKRKQRDEVNPLPLTREAIKTKALQFIDKTPVILDATVYKEGNAHWHYDNETHEKNQVYLRQNFCQQKYQKYNPRGDIDESVKIFGKGKRYDKNYIVDGDRKIPVFRKANLSKFILMNGNQPIDRDKAEPTVYLEGVNKLYIEVDGEIKYLRQERKKSHYKRPIASVNESSVLMADSGLALQTASAGLASSLGIFGQSGLSPETNWGTNFSTEETQINWLGMVDFGHGSKSTVLSSKNR